MRVFVAVHPGERLVRALSGRLDAARRGLPLRWTRPETWHVTLQFLGEWPAARLEALREALGSASGRPPFQVAPRGLGGFPDLRRPRVLFLQIEPDERLTELAVAARGAVDGTWPDGPQDRRPFRPHVTLARVRDRLSRQEAKILGDIDLGGLPEIPVEGFALVASQLRPDGPRYRDLAFWRLRKKGE